MTRRHFSTPWVYVSCKGLFKKIGLKDLWLLVFNKDDYR